ncbi:hypothetical protein CLAIMM_02671 [Cladophialophora immunda]|nr:hypothetical protein CLAIMM_02671 [Cladophialophora immunda]
MTQDHPRSLLPPIDDRIVSPRDEVTALLKQDQYDPENEDLRHMVQQLSNSDSDLAQRVEEVIVGTSAKREYDRDVEPDADGAVEILPDVLDSASLEDILKSVKNLLTFSWCVNMPIPPNILAHLRESRRDVHLRVLKRQMSDDAANLPELDWDFFTAFPLSQTHIDRNDFGSIVYASSPNTTSLRLHLLVPYYPASEGPAEEEWMRRKTAVATSTIESLPSLASIYATDYQGQLPLLIPAIVQHHASTLQVLKLHSLPVFPYKRPNGLLCPTADQIHLLATRLRALTHVEMDFSPFDPTEGGDQMITPFESPSPTTAALSTLVHSLPALRTVRLWIEVPTAKSFFQDEYTSMGSDPPPLKEDRLCQAVANLYALLMERGEGQSEPRKLECLEVAFTRLDTWDRQGAYPRFLTVRLIPSHSPTDIPEGGGDADKGWLGGFTMEVGEWQDDYAEQDIEGFIGHAVGFIH